MKPQSLKSKIILLAVFIILIIGIAVGGSICTKRKPKSMYETYTATYTADENGTIQGEANQSVRQWLDGTEITAVPNDGYLFTGWSDGVYLPTRKDTYFTQNIEVEATFVSKSKTLKYEYNGATSNNNETSVTLNYDDVTSTKFIIPAKANYEFQGWYLDKEFTKRVTDKDGVYYLGKSIFYSDADTLYARWEKHEGIVYPVLIVFIDAIDAQLKNQNDYLINYYYEMSLPELKICEQIPKEISKFINDNFNKPVYFEFDTYFTNTAIDGNSFSTFGTIVGITDGIVYPPCISEVAPLLKNYRSVISTANMTTTFKNESTNQNEVIKFGFPHVASKKYAFISLESNYYNRDLSKPLILSDLEWASILDGYLHEFTHTIEQSIGLDNLHDVEAYNSYIHHGHVSEYHNQHVKISYLLDEAELYGQTVGIPFTFWTGDIEVEYYYDAQLCSEMGAVKLIEDNTEYEPSISRVGKIPYGFDLTVEAVAKDGFKFVKWSDGITTAVRHDTNINSYLYVFPIFTKDI